MATLKNRSKLTPAQKLKREIQSLTEEKKRICSKIEAKKFEAKKMLAALSQEQNILEESEAI